MINEIVANFNFIDIVVGCVFLWCLYFGIRKGIVVEIFKLLGILFATFITLHYYIAFANFLNNTIALPKILILLMSFLILCTVTVVIFKFIREGLIVVLSMKVHPVVNRIGGGVIGSLRSALVCGLLLCFVLLTGNKYLIDKVKRSFSGPYLVDLSPKIYENTFDKFVGRLFPSERKNTEIFQLKEPRKKK